MIPRVQSKSSFLTNTSNWSAGCVPRNESECKNSYADVFFKSTRMKLPDTSSSWFSKTMNLEDCRKVCLENCSCVAYANLDIRDGGSGCLLWFNNLLDLRMFSQWGQDLYIKVPASELDESKRKLLDWHKRFSIIGGIARGLLYLHQDSGLRIIHRDLKTSNILLDANLDAKISDFGLARSFLGDQVEAETTRVAGTYGYMPPEYVVRGHFSVKSDVFSYGVIVLEIVSGRKNREFSDPEYYNNLLGHAWRLWTEEKAVERTTG